MKNVILIQPIVGNWDEVRTSPSLPLALLCVSRLIEKEYNVRIIDQRIDANWKHTLKDELKKDVVCVGVTSMTGVQINYGIEASKTVKEVSDVPVVWGGIHTSLLPEETLKNENVDIVVVGEGEITFCELVKHLDKGLTLEGIDGVWYKSNGMIKNNNSRTFVDLNSLPDLPYNLIDVSKYLPLFEGRKTLNIQTSRGCPNRCSYCYNHLYNKRKWRAFSVDKTLKMIKKAVEEYGARNLYIIDDDFFVDIKRVEEISKGIIKEGWDITWESQGINVKSGIRMSDEFLSLIEKAGCRKVHFGIESGSQDILDMVRKGITLSQIREVAKKFKKYNIICQYNFMAGFPTETDDDLKKTVDLVFELINDSSNAISSPICNYVPYPGTEIFDKAVEEGYKVPSSLEGWGGSNYGNPWVSDKRMVLLKNLFFSSLFLHGSRGMIFSTKGIISNIYKPIARFRVKHLFFKFMIEAKLSNFFIK